MKRIDIINEYVRQTGVSKRAATSAVNTLINIIKAGIINDEFVSIYDFGVISIKNLPEKTSKYISGAKKGKEYIIPAHKKIRMTFSKTLESQLNGGS